jgi:Flp pilus assembly protein TadB
MLPCRSSLLEMYSRGEPQDGSDAKQQPLPLLLVRLLLHERLAAAAQVMHREAKKNQAQGTHGLLRTPLSLVLLLLMVLLLLLLVVLLLVVLVELLRLLLVVLLLLALLQLLMLMQQQWRRPLAMSKQMG